MSTTAPSTATSSASARSSARSIPSSRESRRSTGSDTASRRAELRRFARFSPFGSLYRRILLINAIGLGLLVGGVLYLNQFREGLLDLRAEALATQGRIIAIAVAEVAGREDGGVGLDPVRANLVLRRLAQPTGVRARLYDPSGRLIGDTRSFEAVSERLDSRPLPPPGEAPEIGWLEWAARIYGELLEAIQGRPPLYQETPLAGVATEAEVYAALSGDAVATTRVNSQAEPIVSVALPVQRFKAVHGALVVSTEGGDIDAIVRDERLAILRVFLVALVVSALLSALLGMSVAWPLRRLARAAARSGAAERRLPAPDREALPDYGWRGDEVGELSRALRRMTEALYFRLEAAEAFAADLAHEIKNPLSSLRSAVETLRRAPKPEHRERLMAVIEHDVRRLDRLVTDISNASRLDAELAREAAEPVDLARLLQAVAEVAGDRAEARGVRVAVEADPALHPRGLETRLGQVFRNLVENALSFSPPGSVVRLTARPGPEGRVRAAVEDEGPGVPEDRREAIFGRFYSDRPEGEAYGEHSGLGLSISRQIVEAHGGRVWVEGREDGRRGARFVVELPL